MTSFNIILKSNASSDIFCDNNASDFTNVFPRNIKLNDSKWKIALQSISLGTNFTNVPANILSLEIPHLLIWTGSSYQDGKPPAWNLKIENQFYTMSSLAEYLTRKSPLFFVKEADGTIPWIKYHIGKNDANFLFIDKEFCTIGIHPNLCEWIGIKRPQTEVTTFDYSLGEIFSPYKDFIIFHKEKSISSSKKELGTANIPKLIKVELPDLKTHLNGQSYHSHLSLIPYQHKPHDPIFYKVVKRKEYFNLKNSNLSSLSVRLTDENNKVLEIFSEQPTLLHIIAKKMPLTSFILRLNSSDSDDIFQDNSCSNFRIQLEKPIDLSKAHWEVALTSIIFPSQIDMKDMLTKENFWIEFISCNSWDVNRRVYFDKENIRDLKTLKEAINRKAKEVLAIYGDPIFVFDYSFDKKSVIRCFKPITFTMSNLLNYVIGRDNLKDNAVIVEQPKSIISSREVNLERCKPNTIFLHSDFISPTIVGDKYEKIIKMIPMNNANSFECQHLDFLNVTTNNLSVIQFRMTDERGNNIAFDKNVYNDVILNLVFQKKLK
jgi:hypothetical protein